MAKRNREGEQLGSALGDQGAVRARIMFQKVDSLKKGLTIMQHNIDEVQFTVVPGAINLNMSDNVNALFMKATLKCEVRQAKETNGFVQFKINAKYMKGALDNLGSPSARIDIGDESIRIRGTSDIDSPEEELDDKLTVRALKTLDLSGEYEEDSLGRIMKQYTKTIHIGKELLHSEIKQAHQQACRVIEFATYDWDSKEVRCASCGATGMEALYGHPDETGVYCAKHQPRNAQRIANLDMLQLRASSDIAESLCCSILQNQCRGLPTRDARKTSSIFLSIEYLLRIFKAMGEKEVRIYLAEPENKSITISHRLCMNSEIWFLLPGRVEQACY